MYIAPKISNGKLHIYDAGKMRYFGFDICGAETVVKSQPNL